jgi:hypothetical protein
MPGFFLVEKDSFIRLPLLKCPERRTYLILQLELRISEGAGAFRPLKTGQKETAFRPGPLSSGQIQL